MLEGRCLCGAVTAVVEPSDGHMTACNCENCRRWTGGVNFTFAVVPETAQIEGPIKTITPMPWARRGFCAECGSGIYYKVTTEGELNGLLKVSAGLFNDAGGLPLDVEFYADERPASYDLSKPHRTMTRAEVEAYFVDD